jgi:hypothetical protein
MKAVVVAPVLAAAAPTTTAVDDLQTHGSALVA